MEFINELIHICSYNLFHKLIITIFAGISDVNIINRNKHKY